MKDYEHMVIWLDYFNKTLTKKMGRKVPREKSIFDPSLKELIDASKAAGFEPTETSDKVRYPRRPYVRSGYIILPKEKSKMRILEKIAEKLVAKRAKSSKKP